MKTRSSRNSFCKSGGQRASKGFTLTEVLVTIGIIAILVGISFPAMQMMRQTARKTHCTSNLRQVMMAALAHEANGNGFPRADDGQGGSFMLTLLPYMEENILHDRARMPLDIAIGETYGERLQELSDSQIELLLCPSAHEADSAAELPSQGTYTTHYYGVAGPIGWAKSTDESRTYNFRQITPVPSQGPIGLTGLFSPSRDGKFKARRMQDISDGTSNTFAMGEISGYDRDQMTANTFRSGWAFGASYDSSGRAEELYSVKSIAQGINQTGTELNTLPFGSNHPGGAHFAYADGSIHFIEDQVPVDVLKVFASIDQREKAERINGF